MSGSENEVSDVLTYCMYVHTVRTYTVRVSVRSSYIVSESTEHILR